MGRYELSEPDFCETESILCDVADCLRPHKVTPVQILGLCVGFSIMLMKHCGPAELEIKAALLLNLMDAWKIDPMKFAIELADGDQAAK